MTALADGFAQGSLGFVLYLACVLPALHLARRTEPALVVLAVALAACMLSLGGVLAAGQSLNFWAFMVAYWFFTACFVMCFGAVYKSLSLRILLDLLRRPGRTDDYHLLFERYLVQDSYQNRLAVIREKGLVEPASGGALALSPRGRTLAERVQAVQRAFGITRSG